MNTKIGLMVSIIVAIKELCNFCGKGRTGS